MKRVGFGGIQIRRVSEKQAIEVVRRCYELGVDYCDTARAYTASEERIGKALEDMRDEFFLARAREVSLKNLRTDWIDVYQLHNVSSREVWERVKAPDGALEALYEAKDAGKIMHLGLTSHSQSVLTEIVKGNIETVMIPYNFLTIQPEEELLPLCHQMDVGTIIMKPLGGGAFTNANTALKYVLGNKDIDVVIPGMMTVKEVEENVAIGADTYEFSSEEFKLLQNDKKELGSQFCRTCHYCQPCPPEIPISFALRVESFNKWRGLTPSLEQRFIETKAKVETCLKCGECE